MKSGKTERLLMAAMVAGIVLVSGCATAHKISAGATVNKSAGDEDWKKRTGWENEKTDNPGLWGLLAGLGSLINK